MINVKKYGCLIATILVIGLIGLTCYGFVQFSRKLVLGFGSPYLFVSAGATEGYQAHFVTEGFQDRCISLFVQPARELPGHPVLVATWEASYFNSAVWSRDGTVIACRADVITEEDIAESTLNKQNKDRSFQPKPNYMPFACAYDFRQGKATVLRSTGYGALAKWKSHSTAIEELLNSRGGLGKEVTRREIEEQSKKLDWAQWQIYQNAMRRNL